MLRNIYKNVIIFYSKENLSCKHIADKVTIPDKKFAELVVVWLRLFYDISDSVSYPMPNPISMYIINIWLLNVFYR